MNARDVWITGVGLLTSLGEGGEAHVSALQANAGTLHIDEMTYAPYPIYPLGDVDFGKQIPKKSDQRQMELWQRVGVYASGLALADSGLAHDPVLLSKTNLIVAAGSGERDTAVDSRILDTMSSTTETELLAKEILPTALRPTLFLAQLSNLLAGNISIVPYRSCITSLHHRARSWARRWRGWRPSKMRIGGSRQGRAIFFSLAGR